MKTVGLLIISNIFMTVAWYGHLKDKSRPLITAILLSWAVAFFEYVFQVPANRAGFGRYTLTQLKIMQECITLVVFTGFVFIVFREPVRWNYMVSYGLVVGAVYFAFWG
ncbi:MAG TPA: DMT family protein [Pyrinomonadaceae bacterium]